SVYDSVVPRGGSSIRRRTRGVLVSIAVSALFVDRRAATAGVDRWTPKGPEGASIQSMAVDPTRPDILYVGTHSTAGGSGVVIKSTNGGRTWGRADDGLNGINVAQILVDPIDADRLYARSFTIDGAVFAATGGGAHWEPLPVGFPVYCLAAGRG